MFALGWCFLGVAIISDVFMGAIERITSRKKRVMNPKTKKYTTVTVWNETIANLTLMALGSSAPEIMLSVIELLGRNFYSGELGPSTIVGSAAFNLLCIIAVCVSAIPNGEVRKIKDTSVYAVTATFSLVAYTWLIFILTVNSKNVVDIGEAIITFLLFPVLLLVAFIADQGYLSPNDAHKRDKQSHVITAEIGKEELADMEMKIRQQHGSDLSDSQLARLMELEYMPPVSRAHYRVSAIRHLTGGRRVSHLHFEHPPGLNCVKSAKDNTSDDRDVVTSMKTGAMVGFASQRYAVLENVGTVKIPVVRSGDMSQRVSVQYRTREGTAKEHTDYEPGSGVLVFQPEEAQHIIEIKIIDDIAYETDEEFYVDLFEPKGLTGTTPVFLAEQGAECTVLIMDDDEPGLICFENDSVTIPSKAEDSEVAITVQRVQGGTGTISCSYHTEDASALAGPDYEAAAGTVLFEHGQMTATINLTVKARGRYEVDELFRVVLSKPTQGAKFVEDTDGGTEACILSVIIQAQKETKDRLDRMMTRVQVNWSKAQIGHSNWRDQFVDAIHVGSAEDGGEPTKFDWVMHVLTIPWKLLFALVPPTDYCGGWVCFVCSLLMIALVTAIIGDMASMLGCTMDVPDEVTAITFVALGTSLPDTFASKTAAKMDPYADASVGNVTGSNSVNVFLGLGLPWTIGSIYWAFKDPPQKWIDKYPTEASLYDPNAAFVVPAGTLVFSVVVFSICAIMAIFFLAIRRHVAGGELGGPQPMKTASSVFLFTLWVTYVTISSWHSLKQKD